MVEQIEESMRFDCGTMPLPVKKTPKQWHQEQLARTYGDIAYHHEEHAKEMARTEARNAWLSAIRASL